MTQFTSETIAIEYKLQKQFIQFEYFNPLVMIVQYILQVLLIFVITHFLLAHSDHQIRIFFNLFHIKYLHLLHLFN